MAGAELIGKEEIKEVMDVLKTGVFARYAFDNERQGIWKVRDFEKAFAKYCGTQYALGVTSGSSALKIALTALDVGPGDEVICPAFTFMATYEAVLEVGAIPVMADIDDTLNLDPDDIPNKLTPRTKAVIPVHMCGAPARIDKIMKVAKKHKLLVLEDTAQGLGASFKGKKLGSIGHMGIFSFDHYKTITTGEGGMVITNDLDLYHRTEWYHDHGHDHLSTVSRALDGRTILGFNYRMNELQGALGLAQLRKLDRVIAAQRKNKAVVKEALAGLPGIKFRGCPIPKGIRRPSSPSTCRRRNRPRPSRRRSRPRVSTRSVSRTISGTMFRTGSTSWRSRRRTRKRQPFSDPRNRKATYSRKAIPHAEDLLGRTLIMGISVKMPAAKMKAIRKAIANAAKVL